WVDLWGDLIVIDYKYGAGVPVLPIDDESGEPNPQLMYYALGLCQKYDFEFDRVKLAVLQPRVWKDDEDALTVGTVTIAKMREFEDKVRGAVEAAKSPQAWLRASPDACRWCPASSFCPEVSKGQMDKAGI